MAFDLSTLTPEQIAALTPDTLQLLMGANAPTSDTPAKATAKPPMRKVEIPSYVVTPKDGPRVQFDQRYTWGKDDPQPFKSHGGFRIHVAVLSEDGNVIRDAKPVNLTADMVNAIRALTDKQASALVSKAIA